MRKSKYDEAFPSQPISEKEKQSSEIDKRIELSSEIINLNQQIDSIKKLSKNLKVLGTLAINAIDANEKSLKALNAAMKSSDNIVNGISQFFDFLFGNDATNNIISFTAKFHVRSPFLLYCIIC